MKLEMLKSNINKWLDSINLVDDFSRDQDVLYGESDSEEEIVCMSCARGRSQSSILMPRLPNYKIVHHKKVEYKTNVGVAANEVRQRALGRGRAKRRQTTPQVLSTVGQSVDSALPFAALTKEEKDFLRNAEFDVQEDDQEENEEVEHPKSGTNGSNIREANDNESDIEAEKTAATDEAQIHEVTFEEAMEFVGDNDDAPPPKVAKYCNPTLVAPSIDQLPEPSFTQTEVMQENVSPYYRELYRRKFCRERDDKENKSESADERLQGAAHDATRRKELRKPRSKPNILNSNFPPLTSQDSSCTTKEVFPTLDFPELVSESNCSENQDGKGNLEDMAQFLLNSWEKDCMDGQFEDATSVYSENDLSECSKGDNPSSFRNGFNNNSETSAHTRANEYFKQLEAEVDNDNTDLEDFENISVSDPSYQVFCKKSKVAKETKPMNGIWYSSDEIYNSESQNVLPDQNYDSDATDISQPLDNVLPPDTWDKSRELEENPETTQAQTNGFDMTFQDSNSCNAFDDILANDLKKIHQEQAELKLERLNKSKFTKSQLSCSSSPESLSMLSSSKTDTKHTSFTSEKDESEGSNRCDAHKLTSKEKKKKRDLERLRKFHEKKLANDNQNNGTSETNNVTSTHSSLSEKVSNLPDVWRINGESVIQLNGLPLDCDVSVLQDLIASYGMVKDFEKKKLEDSSSFRFRLCNTDACEMVVSCLDDTDLFGGSLNIKKIPPTELAVTWYSDKLLNKVLVKADYSMSDLEFWSLEHQGSYNCENFAVPMKRSLE